MGKENSNDASKYRPISLLNVGGKVLEKLLINRIMHYLYSNDLLNPNQYGFSPQKSTTDAAMAVKGFIDEALTKGKIVALVSLDVKGAFDAAWWPSILKTLKDFYCPRNLYNLTKNYFSGRSAYISTNSMRIDKTVTKGCPQGSCCGPGYWNIQYNSLLNLNFAKWTRAVAFADDLLLAVKAANVAEVENFTNMEMIKITKWSKENKLNFNDQKSKVVLISRRRKERKAIDIYLNNNRLEEVDKIKYLGIIIDSKFKFNEHIKYITDRCTKLINALSKSARLNWGLKHEALKTIYNGAILPQLLYATPVWVESIKKDCNRAKYVRVQRLISLRIAKAYRTISHEALCILTGLTPIDIKVEEVATLYNITTGRTNQNHHIDKAENPRNWLHPADIASVNDKKDDSMESLWQVFTDGSKSEQGVGSGVAVFTGQDLIVQHKFKLDNRCSNNQAEQLAILKAHETIQTQKVDNNEHRTVVIHTDSKISLDSIRNTKNHNHLAEEIRKRTAYLNKQNWKIEFKWVQAHVGIFGNEIADRLAKEATQNHHITYSRIPKSAIQKDIRKESIRKWQKHWEETTKGAITKEFFPSVESRLAVNLQLSSNITTIMTGHGNIRSYLHRLKIIGDAECPCKHGIQTVEHLIFQCKKLKNERAILKSSLTKVGKWPVNKSELTGGNLKQFIRYVNSMNFEKINQCNE